MSNYKKCLLLLVLVGVSSAFSGEFKSLKYSFDMELKCTELKDGEYCISSNKDVIFNLTVQKRTQSDTLLNYKKHLKSKIVKGYHASKFEKVEKIFINNRTWLSSKHYESEYLLFTTHYFIALKASNAYLISISYKNGALTDSDVLKFSQGLML